MRNLFPIHAEDELILCCSLKIDIKNKKKIRLLINQDLDWEYIFMRIVYHHLVPLIYIQINQEFTDEFPDNFMQNLKEYYDYNTRKNLFMFGELLKILNILKKNSINVIPFKGPVLSFLLYKNVTIRQFNDLDLFVSKKDALKAKKLLISLGYGSQIFFDDLSEKVYFFTQREFKFHNPRNGLNIELHWKLIGLSFSFSNDGFFTNPKTNKLIIQNYDISSLSINDLLIILCIHAAGHRWDRLSWIIDIIRLIEIYEIDWNYILEKSNILNINKIMKINLILAKDFASLTYPKYIINYISDLDDDAFLIHIKRSIFKYDNNNLFNKIFLRLNIREKKIDKIKDFLLVMFLPTPTEWSMIKLPFFLFPLYFIIKPVKIFIDSIIEIK